MLCSLEYHMMDIVQKPSNPKHFNIQNAKIHENNETS
jgi:hypothetical protein